MAVSLSALPGADATRHAELRDRLEARFDRIFRRTVLGFEPPPVSASQFLVITWVPPDRFGHP